MPLGEELRRELAAVSPARRCDRLAELSGLLHGAGSAHLRGRGLVAVHLDVGSSAVARRAFSLLRGFGIGSEIRTYRRRAFDRATRYQLHVEGSPDALEVLREAGVLSARGAPLEAPPKRVVRRACCRGAYLRGALLAAGSVSGPRTPHLEVRTATRAGAELVAAVAGAGGARLTVVERRAHAAAVARGREAIEHVLALAGAGETVLELEEQAVVGSTRARANRRANADHANLVRAGLAAHRQLQAIRRLAAGGMIDELPRPLRDAAELRARHPSLSLGELVRRAPEPVTRPTLHRRLTRLVRLAEGLEGGPEVTRETSGPVVHT